MDWVPPPSLLAAAAGSHSGEMTPQFLSSHGNTSLPPLSRCSAGPSAAPHWGHLKLCPCLLSVLSVSLCDFFFNVYGRFA